MLTVALLFGVLGGVSSVKAAEVKIPIELTGAVAGVTVKAINPATLEELAENPEHIYAAKFTTSDQLQNVIQITNLSTVDAVAAGCDRIIIEFGNAADNAWRFHSYGGQYDGIEEIGGETTHTLMIDGSKSSIDDFTIFNWVGSGVKEIIIKAAYFYKSPYPSIEFNAFGKATIGKGELTATGGLTYNASTGALSTDGTAGTLELTFADPVDLRNLFQFNVSRSGDDGIVDRLEFYDNDGIKINTWNSIKWSNTWNANGIDDAATNAFINNKPVKKMVWVSDADKATTLALTITSVEWQLKTINALKGVDVTTLPFKNWSDDGDNDATVTGDVNSWECAKKFNELTGDVIFGGDGIGGSKRYVDLTNYKKLVIRGYGTIRLFYNWHQKVGDEAEAKPMEYIAIAGSEVKTHELDLDDFKTTKGITHFRLVGVKGSGSCFVESISVLDGTEKVDYYMTGSGIKLPSAIAALNDEKATSIDATGVKGITTTTSTLLESQNPNCLFLGTAGKLSNTKNVIVSGTCANLELTDGKPFKAPAAFTATNAKFTKAVSDAEYATMVIPFNADLAPGVTAKNLTGVSGTTITTTDAATLTANEPVLIHANEGNYEFTATGASISATGDGLITNGLLNASYAGTTAAVSEHNYVLQNSATYGVNFYQVKGTAATMLPFRAYLVTPSDAPVLFLDFGNEVTGINDVRSKMADVRGEVYNLNGQRVAQPTKGLYIVNGKKVVIK